MYFNKEVLPVTIIGIIFSLVLIIFRKPLSSFQLSMYHKSWLSKFKPEKQQHIAEILAIVVGIIWIIVSIILPFIPKR